MKKRDVLSFHSGGGVRDALVRPVPGGGWVCVVLGCHGVCAAAPSCCVLVGRGCHRAFHGLLGWHRLCPFSFSISWLISIRYEPD